MIHQLIFASPKPGLSDKEFCDYWVHTHAVDYAAKIPQICRYAVDTPVRLGLDETEPAEHTEPHEHHGHHHEPPRPAPWTAVAEIWLRSEADQLASLQSPEFVDGARRDEPRWAAFWQTLALDTDAHLWPGSQPLAADRDWVKVFWLGKRREGVPLTTARRYALDVHGRLLADLPGVRRVVQGHTRDAGYAVAEAPLDFAFQLWFDSADALSATLDSPEYAAVAGDRAVFLEPRYLYQLVTRENWVIGPHERTTP